MSDMLTIIKNEFSRRMAANPRYSLRAYARQLHMDPSLLSKILKGERGISPYLALRVSGVLGVSIADVAAPASREILLAKKYQRLLEDDLLILGEWHHFALLELIQTRGFKADFDWISDRLGIPSVEVRLATERLERKGFIKRQKNRNRSETWECLRPVNTWTSTTTTSQARKNLQKQFLAKASEAIEAVPFANRENGSLTVAINSSLIPELKQRVEKFKEEIRILANNHGAENEVYQVCIAVFPLTKNTKNIEEKEKRRKQ